MIRHLTNNHRRTNCKALSEKVYLCALLTLTKQGFILTKESEILIDVIYTAKSVGMSGNLTDYLLIQIFSQVSLAYEYDPLKFLFSSAREVTVAELSRLRACKSDHNHDKSQLSAYISETVILIFMFSC